MISIVALTLVSALLALLLTPPWRCLCRHCGIMDAPDDIRRLHPAPVPRAGGVPVLAAYLGSLALLAASPLPPSTLVREALPVAAIILPGAALVFAAGLADDIRGLKPWQKLVLQAAASSLVYRNGVHIASVAGVAVPQWLTFPLTLFWLTWCSNAFNLIDGMDGLAAGAGLFATLTILLGALLHGNMTLMLVAAPLAGALAGFLPYNFNPASIFLGDSGSLTVGFLLGCYAVLWSQKGPAALGMTAPLMALGLPLLETLLTVARRFLAGKPIFAADRSHMHHRLLSRGLTPRRAVFMLYGACCAAATFSLLSSLARRELKGLIVVLFCTTAWFGIRYLRYDEFGEAVRVLIGGAFRHMLAGQLTLRRFRNDLSSAASVEDCFRILCRASREFGFQRAELQFQGARYDDPFDGDEGAKYRQITIPLSDADWAALYRLVDSPALPMMMPFVDTVQRCLPEKLRQMAMQSHLTAHSGRPA